MITLFAFRRAGKKENVHFIGESRLSNNFDLYSYLPVRASVERLKTLSHNPSKLHEMFNGMGALESMNSLLRPYFRNIVMMLWMAARLGFSQSYRLRFI